MIVDDYAIDVEPNPCKCGGCPEIYTQFPINKQKYQGIVECPNCGNYVRGITWAWTKYDAVTDAVEEWNKVMPEVEEEEVEDD